MSDIVELLEAASNWIEREVNELQRCRLPNKEAKALAARSAVNAAADEITRLRAELAQVKAELAIDEQRVADLMADVDRLGKERDAANALLLAVQREIEAGRGVSEETATAIDAHLGGGNG